ncbi:carbohydrate esterase family 16 protein [Hyaloscypha variabilis]
MKLVLGTAFCYWPIICKALPAYQPSSSFNWNNANFLLAFGDSYTYVQGTAGLQNYSFIGDLQNYSYSPQTLLTDEIVQNQIGTSAGGPNWVEYLTGCFSGLPSKCKRQLWDFAFAGSDVSTTYTPLHHNFTVSFVNQIKQWAIYAKPVISVDLSKALVAIFIGINDISDSSKYTFPRNNATDFPSFYSEIIQTEFQAIEQIYDAGYRDFLFMNLPPLDRTPSNQATSHPLPNSTMVHEYNAIISTSASKFSASHPGTTALVFDTYSFLSGILDNPSEYGIKNTTGFCPNYDAPDIATNYAAYGCLPIQEYFWYDAGHITWKVHEFLAGAVGKFLDGESCDN